LVSIDRVGRLSKREKRFLVMSLIPYPIKVGVPWHRAACNVFAPGGMLVGWFLDQIHLTSFVIDLIRSDII
jgi:hypothetical protein